MSATGAEIEAAGKKSSLNFAASFADTNARIADMTADSVLRQGQRAEQASRLETRNLKEKQRNSFAANGIALDSETANRVLTSTDLLGEVDANTLNANAARSAWGYRMEATGYRGEALVNRATANAIRPKSAFRTSLINSAGNISTSAYKLYKAGAFSGSGG